MSDIKEIVQELIYSKTEGTYWDFKEIHHQNKAELIHDIICLANARHDGDRYLIYGVKDETGEIVGVNSGERKWAGDNITALFKDNALKFFASRYPECTFHTISLHEKEVDVVVIKNTPFKPYSMVQDYLSSNKQNREKRIRAHHIYTRVQKTNTAIDKSADFYDIEYMWKEQFGLTQSPLDRMKIFLCQPQEEWGDWNEEYQFYKQVPEFIIDFRDENKLPLDYTQEWTRGEIGSHYQTGNWAYYACLKFRQTTLYKVHVVLFDGGKKNIAAPSWEPLNRGRFYYYLEDSIEYTFQKYIANGHQKDNSLDISSGTALSDWNESTFSIPVLKNKSELEKFIEFVCERHPQDDEHSRDTNEQNRIFMKNLELYEEFRKS
ncbi:MAG: ATP-binding protein [Rhodobacteraceae bacterium]|nr:ATP-binding protein [Paracoccaceae bacterium]